MSSWRQWWREPLLHFLILGGALFALYRWQNFAGEEAVAEPREIVVTTGRIANLVQSFSRIWQRPPSAEELDGLIEDYIREEIFYREALDLGLDRDDTIIRRRLRQKMEFISEDVAEQFAPTDDELRAYLNDHADAYRVDPRLSFRHVYLSADRRGDSVQSDAAELLAELQRLGGDAPIDELGDPLLLDPWFEELPLRDVVSMFGQEFADEIRELPEKAWDGPVKSGYGLHLVFLDERAPGRIPDLDEVREAVVRDWTGEKQREANEALYQSLRRQYTITIERPAPPVDPDAPEGDT